MFELVETIQGFQRHPEPSSDPADGMLETVLGRLAGAFGGAGAPPAPAATAAPHVAIAPAPAPALFPTLDDQQRALIAHAADTMELGGLPGAAALAQQQGWSDSDAYAAAVQHIQAAQAAAG
jgi:hypothetical protein